MMPTKRAANSKVTEGVDAVEIKLIIRPDQELQGLRALKLDEDSAEIRVIYFYDATSLELFNAGVVLRARLVKGDIDDTTVKIRPFVPGKSSLVWSKINGFKIEADRTGNRVVCSASLTQKRKRAEIEEVAEGKRSIQKLFTKDQLEFLSEFYKKAVDFERLKAFGPIRVLCWSTVHKGFPYKLTSEEWRLPDGEDLLEVSIKVEREEAEKAQASFEDHVRGLGLDPGGAQGTKTRSALEYFVRALKSRPRTSTSK